MDGITDTLFFIASKVVWAVISPGSVILIAFAAGLALLLVKRTRPAKAVLGAGVALYALIAFLPVGEWLAWPLETRFPANPELPAQVDGIVMLGGSIEAVASYGWNRPQLGDAADRNVAFLTLARRYPDARLVFTGGSGSVLNQEYKEADVARTLFDDLGLPPERVIYERDSRNTHENAVNSKALAAPVPGETWILITSATHMPRSVGVFCEQDWPVIPYPVDQETTPGRLLRVEFNFSDHLYLLESAVREWVGLTAYFFTGRTGSWYPGGC